MVSLTAPHFPEQSHVFLVAVFLLGRFKDAGSRGPTFVSYDQRKGKQPQFAFTKMTMAILSGTLGLLRIIQVPAADSVQPEAPFHGIDKAPVAVGSPQIEAGSEEVTRIQTEA